MKRPRNHIIEEESERILKSVIPPEWVFRKLDQDYGIDYLVEIFAEGQSTGLHFFIQLKGTEIEKKDNTASYQLSKKHIEYYGKLALPILLVYVHVGTHQIWAKWINKTAIGKTVKSRKIYFSQNDFLDKVKVLNITESLSAESPPIRLNFIGEGDDILVRFLMRWFTHYFKENLITGGKDICDDVLLTFRSKNSQSIEMTIEDDRFLFKSNCSIPLIYREELIKLPEIDEIPASIRDVFYHLSKIFLLRGCKEAVPVLLSLFPHRPIDDTLDLFTVVSACIGSKDYHAIEEFGIDLIENEKFDLIQFLNMSLYKYHDNAEAVKIKERLLIKCIEKVSDQNFRGMLHYNLANHYQNTDMRRLSIHHYIQASKKEPDYLNRGYWYRELAGVLFLEKKYHASLCLYKKCLTFKEHSQEPITYALAGDASFMSREFSDSLAYFEKYAELAEHTEMEFILKKQTIKSIKDQFDLNMPFSPLKANKMFEEIEKANELNSDEKIDACLKLDPICPQACYQSAINLQNKNKYEEACLTFLVSALVAEWNVGAWLNSFFMALEVKNHMMGIVLNVAYKKCGYALIEPIRDEILSNDKISPELGQQVLDAFVSQFQEYEKMKELN